MFFSASQVRQRMRGTSSLYLWPLMSMLWAFDCSVVAKRSKLVQALKSAQNVAENNSALAQLRDKFLENKELRDFERFPEPVGWLLPPSICVSCEANKQQPKAKSKSSFFSRK